MFNMSRMAFWSMSLSRLYSDGIAQHYAALIGPAHLLLYPRPGSDRQQTLMRRRLHMNALVRADLLWVRVVFP